jgi:hypothetical protein
MRLVGAGIFVYASVLLLVAALGSQNAFGRARSWLVGLGIAAFMVGMVALATWLFNRRGAGPFERKTADERIRALDEAGQLESVSFRATRAFGVEESEDEGLHYFLELADGRVLFLSGQYLYDYEPISDDADEHQPRSFPCAEFTVRRHKAERYVLDILRGGAVLEPEVIAPPFQPARVAREADPGRRPGDRRHHLRRAEARAHRTARRGALAP